MRIFMNHGSPVRAKVASDLCGFGPSTCIFGARVPNLHVLLFSVELKPGQVERSILCLKQRRIVVLTPTVCNPFLVLPGLPIFGALDKQMNAAVSLRRPNNVEPSILRKH